jgi:trans-aconitate methyltransferase
MRMFRSKLILGLLFTSSLNCLIAEEYEERFERIYREKMWGANDENEGSSGGGSTFENARPYYEYLTRFLQEHKIKSVVDLGCGDWMLSKYIDWTDIDYTGYDVVESVIDKNIQKYGSDTIRFINANFLNAEVPAADLLICKHVLQHIPNKDVFRFIKLLPKYKHCLILNAMPVGQKNIDHPIMREFPFWDDRGIDLTLPPFSIKGKHVLKYEQRFNSSGMDLLTHINNTQD